MGDLASMGRFDDPADEVLSTLETDDEIFVGLDDQSLVFQLNLVPARFQGEFADIDCLGRLQRAGQHNGAHQHQSGKEAETEQDLTLSTGQESEEHPSAFIDHPKSLYGILAD